MPWTADTLKLYCSEISISRKWERAHLDGLRVGDVVTVVAEELHHHAFGIVSTLRLTVSTLIDNSIEGTREEVHAVVGEVAVRVSFTWIYETTNLVESMDAAASA